MLKADLPLAELEAAKKDVRAFMHNRLQELGSQDESRDLIRELTNQLSKHDGRVWELIQDPHLAEGEVSQHVMVGLMASQPLEVNFFPGILEGLVGRLGLASIRTTDPPASIRDGVARCWAAAIRAAVRDEDDANPGAVPLATPHGLHISYDVDFCSRRVRDIAPTLTSPLFPSLVRELLQPEKAQPAKSAPPPDDLPPPPEQPPPS